MPIHLVLKALGAPMLDQAVSNVTVVPKDTEGMVLLVRT